MLKQKMLFAVFLFMLFLPFLFLALALSPANAWPFQKKPSISITGRLALEKHGKREQLILHAKDGQAYLIKGLLSKKLKDVLSDLGEKNLVSVTGTQDGRSNVSCIESRKYEYDQEGRKRLMVNIKCYG